MDDHDHIVAQVVSRARIPRARRRREIEREIRDHLEDMAESDLARFGDPGAVGEALADVYAAERLALQVARGVTLVIASGIAATVVIASVQIAMTIGTAIPLSTMVRQIGSERVGLVAVALGYCGSYFAKRQFHCSFRSATALILLMGFGIGTGLSVLNPAHAVIATVAFFSAAFGGLLACAPTPLLWLAGTAGPLLIAGIAFGPLLPGTGRFPWLMWLGLSLSCVALRIVAHIFERHVFCDIGTSDIDD